MNQTTSISTRKEAWISLAALLLIAVLLPLYILREPVRLASTQSQILQGNLDAAMTLYAENCAVCHGIRGEGIGANPPLNTAGLAGSEYDALFKVIERGRYQTAMPAWGQGDGGPLSDYQVGQLAALVQKGDWAQVETRVVNLDLQPLIPFASEPDPDVLARVKSLPNGNVLAQGIEVFAEKCVSCHGADGLGTKLAPAVNDTTVREKGADEIARLIRQGVPGTLMAAWERSLPADDLEAMVALIGGWDRIPTGAIPAPDIEFATTAESLIRGESLYTQNCSWCHGSDGQGARRFPALNYQSFLAETSDPALQQITTMGVSGTAMPAWGDRLSDADIQAIVGFMRSWEATAPAVAPATRGRGATGETGGGGPPWLRNQASPSGASATPTPQASVTSAAAPAPTVTPAQGAHVSGQAGGGTAQQPAAGGAQQTAAGGTAPPGPGYGPRSQALAAAPEPGWDWRQWLLLGSIGLAAIVLVGGSAAALRRLPAE